MTEQPAPPEHDDQAAIAYCREAIRRSPEATYKEIRREAFDAGIKITRRVFTTVQRETSDAAAGLRTEDAKREAEPGAEVTAEDQEDGSPVDAEAKTDPEVEPVAEDSTRAGGRGPHDRGRHGWNQLFGSSPDETPTTDQESEQAPSDGSGGAAVETPTESARRALGLLSSPAASDEPRQNAVEFMVNYLRDKPEAPYREVREAAESSGYTVSSATFGRAQSIVGILEDDTPSQAAKPSESQPKEAEPTTPRPALRGRRARDPASLLEDFIDAWENTSQDREVMERALKEMLKVVNHALE